MAGQILPNNNEKCYSNFSPYFSQLNTAYLEKKVQTVARDPQPANNIQTSKTTTIFFKKKLRQLLF
jgi:hypothetical protein